MTGGEVRDKGSGWRGPEQYGHHPGRPRLAELRTTPGRLLDEDAEAFSVVMAVFKLPMGTNAEKKARSEAVQAGYRHAIDIPLHTAAACVETARLGVEVSRIFNADTAASWQWLWNARRRACAAAPS